METAGNRVKKLRIDLGMNQEDFGARIGLKKNSLSQIENGKNSLSEKNIIAISREFNVDAEWLRSGTGEPFPERKFKDEIKNKIDILLNMEEDDFRVRLANMILSMKKDDIDKLEQYAKTYLMPRDKVNPKDDADENDQDALLPFA